MNGHIFAKLICGSFILFIEVQAGNSFGTHVGGILDGYIACQMTSNGVKCRIGLQDRANST